MKAEQHIYTSGKPEFMTVAITGGLSREERLQLETNSLYILPTSLMYQEGVKPPVKYVYYPLGEKRVVVGRALYAGKDSLGRPGNYLFHNIIVDKDDLFEYFAFNPLALIRYLDGQGIFQDSFLPEQTVSVLELSPEKRDVPASSPASNETELSQLLHICLKHRSFQLPLLLRGQEEQLLGFLDRLFPLLPYDLREELSFDSYCYNTGLGFRILGQPEAEEFRQSLSPALTLRLADGQFSVSCDLSSPLKRLELMTGLLSAGRWAELDSFHDLERDWRREAYADVRKKYRELASDLQRTFLNFHREAVLTYIVDTQDTELLRLIQEYILVEDLHILARSAEMLLRFVEVGNPRNSKLFVVWLCLGTSTNRSAYPLLFRFLDVWKLFLVQIAVEQPEKLSILLESLEYFPEQDMPDYEYPLLDASFELIPVFREESKASKEFLKRQERFPVNGSQEIILLRDALKYALSKEVEVLNLLLSRDLSILPEQRRRAVLEVLLHGIFRTKKLEEMEFQLKTLLERAANNRLSLLLTLTILEAQERSKKVRSFLDSILEQLLQKYGSDRELATTIQRLLKPPPSFFQKLRDKILGEL